MAGDGGATDAGQGAAQNHFQGVSFNDGTDEVISQVMQDGPGDFRSQRPLLVTGTVGGFLQGEDQPGLVQTGGLDSGGGDQGQGALGLFFSGHRGF